MIHQQEDRPVADLVRDLGRETSELIRKEIELAKVEMAGKVPEIKMGIGSMASAGGIIFGGYLMLLISASLGLDRGLAMPWLSFLIIGVLATVVGALALIAGRRRMRIENLTPQHSLTSLRRDRDTVARHASAH